MMVSITPCWRKRPERFPGQVLALLYGLLLGWWIIGSALAGSIEPKSAKLVPDEQGRSIVAEFAIDLGPRLEEAVSRGVALDFRFEFVLTRERRYWMDEHVTGRIVDYRLSFQALTRQYRLTIGSLHQNYATLDEALQALSRVARLHVIDKGLLKPGETYLAAVRLSLDHTQLPKPLQIDALADRDWRIDTTPLRWSFVHEDK